MATVPMVPNASPDGKCTSPRRDGQPCKKWAIKGGNVCKDHGGNLPNVKGAARFRLARDAAQKAALDRLRADKAGRVETITEMDRLAAEALAFKDTVRELLEGLLDRNGGELRYEGKTGEQLRAEVALYERALDRCNTILATNIKLGIHEKRLELDKLQAQVIAQTIRTILDRIGLTTEQKKVVPGIIVEEMKAISTAVS